MNMLTALHAVEHDDFAVIAISPGWLKIDLARPDADLHVEVGVASVLDKILEADKSESGKFYTIRVTGWDDNKMGPYDGRRLPW
ncbi:uncharacterized protein RHO25_000037 [Cercospora beticola]|uniref:Uncharacterized protein n=1 Tax=Cercospora beticola TaxID=122368 RepID=A0ABZ0N6E9_CERBT|nr:hypothetical protein RHO25_000037 [Cercospora beticola]CAK1356347.1 unnamed protein product [Cercospora beticola]